MNSINLSIDLNFQQLVELVKQLSPSEKLKLNDVIWNENSEIPIEHQLKVLERFEESKKNPSVMVDFDEAIKMLNSNEI